MSKVIKFIQKIDPVSTKTSQALGIDLIKNKEEKAKKAAAAAAAAAAAGAPSAAGAAKAAAVQGQQATLEQRAAAAGVTRSGNKADVLGDGSGNYTPKKKRAAKDLLGE